MDQGEGVLMNSTAEVIGRMGGRLDGMASWVARVYRMDRDDMRAEADYLALMAVGEYTPARGDLENWVAFYVGKRLRSAARREARRLARLEPLADALAVVEPARFDPADLGLSPDALAVVEAVLGGRVALESRLSNPRPERLGRQLRERVRIHFLVRDWSLRRVRRAMVELRGAFS